MKAKKLIQKADVVVYSGSLIPEPILKLCKKGKLLDVSKLHNLGWKHKIELSEGIKLVYEEVKHNF